MHRAASRAIRVSCAVAFLTLAAISVFAQAASKPSGGLPPLIDRDLFDDDPEISNAQISPERQVHRVRETLEGDAKRLGQEE